MLFGLPATLLGVAMSRPLLVAMQAEQSTIDAGAPYLQIYFLGLVFLWANLIGTAIFRGAGNMHTPLKIALTVNALNIALNYIFIYGVSIYGVGSLPAFGVRGAAIGTVVARTCSAAIYLWLLYRGVDHVRLRWRATPVDETDKTTQPAATRRRWPPGEPRESDRGRPNGVSIGRSVPCDRIRPSRAARSQRRAARTSDSSGVRRPGLGFETPGA